MFFDFNTSKKALGALSVSLMMMTGSAANATIVTVFDGITAGTASFDSTVAGAGGTVTTDVWTTFGTGTSVDRGDYTVTRNNGGSISTADRGISGRAISIAPNGSSSVRTDPLDYKVSGITFTFDTAINAIGFEVEDWATCCHDPTTDLFIQFDGGVPILVASADDSADGRFPDADDPNRLIDEIFVAAFDDSAGFTSVSFWGNGSGEVLYAGGQVKYALLGQGTLPGVPLPAAGWLMLAGFGALGATRRGRKSKA